MISDHVLMAAQTIAICLTFVLQAFSAIFAYAQYKKFRKDKTERIYNKLIPVMQRGMGGVNIPGLSDKAGEQLKGNVRRILKEELG